MTNGMTPDEARARSRTPIRRRRAHARAARAHRSRPRRPGTTRRVVERVRAGSSLRAARAAPQTRLRRRASIAHARTRHRRERDDVRHRRSPALPSAGVPRRRRIACTKVYLARMIGRERVRRTGAALSTVSRLRRRDRGRWTSSPRTRSDAWPSARANPRASCTSARRPRRSGSCSMRSRSSGASSRPKKTAIRGAANVVVLAHRFWQSRVRRPRATSSAKRSTIGPSVYTIIGVAPRRLPGGRRESARRVHSDHAPRRKTALDDLGAVPQDVQLAWLEIFARRKPGVTIDAANADLTAGVPAELARATRR